jgi:hypothetical protein
VPPEHVRILGNALFPVLLVAEANHGVAEILHTFGLHAVTLLALGKVVRWTVDVDGRETVLVEKIRLSVALLDAWLRL